MYMCVHVHMCMCVYYVCMEAFDVLYAVKENRVFRMPSNLCVKIVLHLLKRGATKSSKLARSSNVLI